MRMALLRSGGIDRCLCGGPLAKRPRSARKAPASKRHNDAGVEASGK